MCAIEQRHLTHSCRPTSSPPASTCLNGCIRPHSSPVCSSDHPSLWHQETISEKNWFYIPICHNQSSRLWVWFKCLNFCLYQSLVTEVPGNESTGYQVTNLLLSERPGTGIWHKKIIMELIRSMPSMFHRGRVTLCCNSSLVHCLHCCIIACQPLLLCLLYVVCTIDSSDTPRPLYSWLVWFCIISQING